MERKELLEIINRNEDKKKKLDSILEEFSVQPVGHGYIDCICPYPNIEHFVKKVEELCIKIEGFTWWCFVNDGHKSCGMGGPKNKFGSGWYSEIELGKVYEFTNHTELLDYLLRDYPKCKSYKPCFVPGFWLELTQFIRS